MRQMGGGCEVCALTRYILGMTKNSPDNCSIAEASRWMAVSRGTLTKWVEDRGAPCKQTADKSKGIPWLVSVPDLIAWHIEVEKSKAVEAAIKKISPDGTLDGALEAGFITIEEAKRRRAVADALIREIQLDREAGAVVPIEDVARIVSREYAAVREVLLGIGPRVAPRVVGQSEAPVIADEIRGAVDIALESMQADTNGIDLDEEA